MNKKKVVIIGSGPAGYSAAIYLSRANVETVLFTGDIIGGQLTQTHKIDNYPGFDQSDPFLLMDIMHRQAKSFGTIIKYDTVEYIKKVDEKIFKVITITNDVEECNAILIATGAQARWLPLPGLEKYLGKGYHGCATCDGAFYKDKIVMVVGGGNTAFEDALFLTRYASKVYLVHRNNTFKAEEILQQEVKNNSKIQIITDTEVVALKGDNKVESVVLKNNITNEEYEMKIDGVFIAIGKNPASAFVPPEVQKDEQGYIKKDENNMTTVKGIFVAGDICNPMYKQAIIAAGDGAKASFDILRYLKTI